MSKQFLETQKQDPGNNQPRTDNFERSMYLALHEMNTSEGGEFLDDAIRMEDQPLGDTDTGNKSAIEGDSLLLQQEDYLFK